MKCPDDLKPGCKFKFVHLKRICRRKLVNMDHKGILEGPFYKGSPDISLAGPILGSIRGSGLGGSPDPLWSSTMTKKVIQPV